MKNGKIRFIIIVAVLMATSIFSLRLFFQQRIADDRLDIHIFPYSVGEWKGKDLEITQKEYDILETRNLISREYTSPSGERLYLFIIYSETNRSVFHPPEVCMMGGGLKIADKRRAILDSSGLKFSVNKLYMQKDNYRGMALYCYKAGKLYTDNFYLQQAFFALNQLSGKHKGGATIRVSMSITKDEQTAFETLKEFMIGAVRIINNLPAH